MKRSGNIKGRFIGIGGKECLGRTVTVSLVFIVATKMRLLHFFPCRTRPSFSLRSSSAA